MSTIWRHRDRLAHCCKQQSLDFARTKVPLKSVHASTSLTKTADDRAATSLTGSGVIMVDLRWNFAVRTKSDINGVEVPEADISVMVNYDTINIGKYAGYPREVKNIIKSKMPKDAILAARFGLAVQERIFTSKRRTRLRWKCFCGMSRRLIQS